MDHYQRLGVARSSDFPTIQKAYHQLALKYHPDRNPKTGDLFAQINAAYEVLSDPKKRQAYDLTLPTPNSPVRPAPKPPTPCPVQNTYKPPSLEFAFNFRSADLECNRRGEFSLRQKEILTDIHLNNRLGIMIVGSSSIFICGMVTSTSRGSYFSGDLFPSLLALSLILFLIGGVIGMTRLKWYFAPKFDSLEIAQIITPLQAKIPIVSEPILETPNGALKWEVSNLAVKAIDPQKTYRVYYLKNPPITLKIKFSGILSIEVI